jgi:CRISPR-associated protein Csd2
MSESIQNRYDFLYLFDVTDGNPNGDPDAGNLPRVDPQTFQGLVTDGCLKRKIRDYVIAAKDTGKGSAPGYAIYFQTKGGPEKRVLNAIHQQAYDAIDKKSKDKKYADQVAARAWMCGNFYDVRTFGAVMSTDINCGQVRGPAQITFARSYHPIAQQEVAISRKAVTTTKEADEQIKKHGDITGTLGRKSIVPYGLYATQGFISPQEAAGTGFTEADFTLLLRALSGRAKNGETSEGTMFDLDRSASRGLMAAQKLFVFKHTSKLGNAPAHKLFGAVKVELTPACKAAGGVPRAFADYTVILDRSAIPQTVEVIELI